jgi:hypothetical protein
VVEVNGKQLLIEIAVTHFINDVKKEKLKRLNISTLEIDLSKFDRQITLNELEEILIEGIEIKKWIYNTKQIAFRDEIQKLGKEFKVVHRGMASHIDNCPLQEREWKGKYYANLIDDCFECSYYFNRYISEIDSKEYITCLGHANIQIINIISRYKKM